MLRRISNHCFQQIQKVGFHTDDGRFVQQVRVVFDLSSKLIFSFPHRQIKVAHYRFIVEKALLSAYPV